MTSGFLRHAAKRLKNRFRGAGTPVREVPVVLCADDDDAVRTLCSTVLSRSGFRTDTARNGREVLERIDENQYAAIVLDLDMPFVHGATVLAILAQRKPEVLKRIIVLSGLPSAAVEDYRGRVAAVHTKPVRNDVLLASVRSCCPPDQLPAETGEASITALLHGRASRVTG